MSSLLIFLGLVVYVGGVWKFWNGFRATNFDPSLTNRISLSLLWPILVIANKSYRHNFQKALKSGK